MCVFFLLYFPPNVSLFISSIKHPEKHTHKEYAQVVLCRARKSACSCACVYPPNKMNHILVLRPHLSPPTTTNMPSLPPPRRRHLKSAARRTRNCARSRIYHHGGRGVAQVYYTFNAIVCMNFIRLKSPPLISAIYNMYIHSICTYQSM